MIGHKKQQTFFRQAFLSGQLSHAYLLTGPEGIGKKLFAKEFAKGLLCPHKRFFAQCDCPSCLQVGNNSHPDYYVYEEKADLNIESVRQIAENASMSTYSGGWRAVIIDNVHILCQADASAANALLKTIEEPGINTVCLLVTHKLDRVLPTIQSRCVNVRFDPLSDNELLAVLKSKGIEPGTVLPYAAGSVSGAMALSAIDAGGLMSSLDSGDLGKLGMQILGMTDKDKFAAAMSAMQGYFLERYKCTRNPDIAMLLQYMDGVVKNLTYNVNMPLVLLDFYVKLADTLSFAGAAR